MIQEFNISFEQLITVIVYFLLHIKFHPVLSTEFNSFSCSTPILFEGMERYQAFVSKITLHVPFYGTIECTGDRRPDKKGSFDTAALAMLYELQEQGLLIIGNSK